MSAKKKAIWVLIVSLIIAVCTAGFVRLRQADEDSFTTAATLGPKDRRSDAT